MLVYKEPTDAESVNCPYIEGNSFKQKFAILKDLTGEEFDFLLTNGWRHFGYYFFIPNCSDCKSCTPIRTMINSFYLSKSQKKNKNKNDNLIRVEFTDLVYSDEIYNIYKKHSLIKFNQKSNKKDFIESFFSDALMGNSKLSLYYIESKLVGVGFIDISDTAISSIYFCYDTDYSKLGLGVFSVIKEIEYGNLLNKKYYYLGYYIKENSSMDYKANYNPYELLSWDSGLWENNGKN